MQQRAATVSTDIINDVKQIREAVAVIRKLAADARTVVFVSGNFNIVHPGHLRLLNFAAECGDFLVVGVSGDKSQAALLPQHLRLEGIRAIGAVDFALILDVPAEMFIAQLQPSIVVKGKEYEALPNAEQAVVDAFGGRLFFSAGEMRFSSFDLLQKELNTFSLSSIRRPSDFPARHGFKLEDLPALVGNFSTLKVVVVGDLIVDEYITCDPIGMSQEDPTVVVTPIQHDTFLGGAGIVAAHACALGASVRYFGVAGEDAPADFARKQFVQYGVDACLLIDDSRPTTLKQRYRAQGKTLLRVSHLRRHDISQALIARLLLELTMALEPADLLIFADFNYGTLPQTLVDSIATLCNKHQVPMVADSQSSSQIGDISRFRNMLLVTPTEHEARLALRDQTAGLHYLSEGLCRNASAQHVFITLGAEGLLVHSPGNGKNSIQTDLLPAFNSAPKDVSGAGDCLMTCASMALATGADIWKSAYLGSIAAACQVGRVGNAPLSAAQLVEEILR